MCKSSDKWFLKSSVYQVNPRTFSKEGTVNAVTKELLFLKELGFKIIYLCPIFKEDDSENREFWSERQLASETNNPKNPYRMNSYFEIDSEYGTMEDLREFVRVAHSLDQKVILDLVFMHIGPNAPVIYEHPEFVKRDAEGNMILGGWNFPLFNFDNNGCCEYLWSNMVFYTGDIGVDGFRCDVGDEVPLEFWTEGLRRIRCINPDAVLINEGKKHEYLETFDAMYAFHWHNAFYDIMVDSAPVSVLREAWEEHSSWVYGDKKFLIDVDNHDTVTDWPDRTENYLGHNGMELVQVINFLIDGIPMVYCGNELACTQKLSLFANRFHMGKYGVSDRDAKNTKESLRRQSVFKCLNKLKSESDVLCNGKTVWLDNTRADSIISFERVLGSEKIVFVGNLSQKEVTCEISGYKGVNKNNVLIESEEKVSAIGDNFKFPPYTYIAFKA